MHKICRHIRTSGGRCRSVAVANQNFCYYHLSQRRRAPAHLPVELPPLEDRGAIQIAISRVLSALAAGLIDRRDAGMYLYGIQIAASNFGRNYDRIFPENDVRRIVLTRNNEEIAAPETYMDQEDEEEHQDDWDHYACAYIEADNPAQPHHLNCRCGECEQRLAENAGPADENATEEPQALTIRAAADVSVAAQEICPPRRSEESVAQIIHMVGHGLSLVGTALRSCPERSRKYRKSRQKR